MAHADETIRKARRVLANLRHAAQHPARSEGSMVDAGFQTDDIIPT